MKYMGKEHTDHLIGTLKENYKFEEDWNGSKHLGIMLDLDCVKHKAHLSMTGYLKDMLHRFR